MKQSVDQSRQPVNASVMMQIKVSKLFSIYFVNKFQSGTSREGSGEPVKVCMLATANAALKVWM